MMRCFLPCFGASKRRKPLRRSANATPTRGGQTHVAEGAIQLTQQKSAVEELIDCIAESKIKNEEQSNNIAEVISTKELIKNFEGIKEEEETLEIGEKKDNLGEDDEINKRLPQEEYSESLFSLCIDSGKQVSGAEKDEIEVNSRMQLDGALCTRKEVSEAFGSTPSVPHENLSQGKLSEKEDTELLEEQPSCIAIRKVNPNEEESSAKEPIKKMEENEEARPSNHSVPEYRYRDCTDEGYEGINLDDSDFDATFEEGDDPSPHNNKKGREGEEESSESLFSLSSYSRKRISSAEKEKEENEVNSVMSAHVTEQEETQGRIPDVSSVLKPIENHIQWRVVKATVQQPLKKEKENINLEVQDDDDDILICPETSKGRHKFNNKKEETVVDTSLSSWLVEPENTPISMNSSSSTNSVGVGEHQHTPKGGRGSPFSHDDRPILGALTVEEIRKYSLSTTSPRRSKSRSPDDTPIIGTVGSYWSHHTGRSMNSEMGGNKSGKDAKLKWSSPKLKTRLEPAFEASAAEV